MKYAIAAVLVLAVGPAVGFAQVITPDELKTLAEQIQQEADDWNSGLEIEEPIAEKLAKRSYDDEGWRALQPLLNACKNDAVGAYTAARLMLPLRNADKAMAGKIINQVRGFAAKFKYRTPPKYSEAALKNMNYPEHRPGANSEGMLRAIDASFKQREEKTAKEYPIRQFNMQAGIIDQTAIILAVKADNDRDDNLLLRQMEQAREQNLLTWKVILDSIMADAANMSDPRVKKFHAELKKLGEGLLLKTSHYVRYGDPSNVLVKTYDNAIFAPKGIDVSLEYIKAANTLAKRIGEPEIKVPDGSTLYKMRQDAKRAGR